MIIPQPFKSFLIILYTMLILTAFLHQEASAGNKYAVIIGISKYKDPQIPSLKYAENDARSIYDVLTDPNYGAIPRENVTLLVNEQATVPAIKTAIGQELARRVKRDDTVFIYFAGHGGIEADLTNESQDGFSKYWICYESDPKNLFGTALDNTMVIKTLRRIDCKRMVTFLDSCYSAGTVSYRALTRAPVKTLEGEGTVTIAASDGSQPSLELDEYQHGLFTYYLLDGIKGAANSDGDYDIDVDELWEYLKNNVKDKAREVGGNQEPVRLGTSKGDIIISKVPRDLAQAQRKRLEVQRLAELRRMAEEKKNLEAMQKERAKVEEQIYQLTKEIDTVDAWQRYIDDYPDGKYISQAKQRIEVLTAPTPTPSPKPTEVPSRASEENKEKQQDVKDKDQLGDYLIVNINSDPSRARVLLDGKYIGRTPRKIKIKRGMPYNIKILKDGYKTFEKTIDTMSIEASFFSLEVSLEKLPKKKEKEKDNKGFFGGFSF